MFFFLRTNTGSLQARPLHVKLADSGSAAPELVAAQTAEFTRGPVIITSTVTFHPAIVRDRERSTAAHCNMHTTHTLCVNASILCNVLQLNKPMTFFSNVRVVYLFSKRFSFFSCLHYVILYLLYCSKFWTQYNFF